MIKDPLKLRQKELLDYHTKNGFIDVRKLENGTLIWIKTEDEVYEFEVGTSRLGVVLFASNRRFEQRDKAILTGSLDPITKVFVPRIIGEGLKIVLRTRKGDIIHTLPVIVAKITGRNYEYELWRDK